MKFSYLYPGFSAALALLVLGGPSTMAQSASKEVTLIDFTDIRRDRNGKVELRPYEYAYGEWDKHVVDLVDRGVLIQTPSGKGGMGENRTRASFRGCTGVVLHFSIGNANQAQNLGLMLEDRDGTQQTWNIRLAEQPVGRPLRQHLDLSKPDNAGEPGKKPGLDLNRISTWQIKGDWSDPRVEVLLIRLVGEK